MSNAKDDVVQADDVYEIPQYNGLSATFYSEGEPEEDPPEDMIGPEGLNLATTLIHDDAPDGKRIRKTPKGIGSDKPQAESMVNHVEAEIVSPLSGKVIIRHHADGSTERFICEACAEYVAEKGGSHALDPIFFWGAGIYHHKTQKTPKGTMAYMSRKAMGRFIKYLPYEMKNNWEEDWRPDCEALRIDSEPVLTHHREQSEGYQKPGTSASPLERRETPAFVPFRNRSFSATPGSRKPLSLPWLLIPSRHVLKQPASTITPRPPQSRLGKACGRLPAHLNS